MRNAVRFAPNAIAASVAAFAVLIGLAMKAYPGGTEWDPTAQGHRFWLNYVCDLARRTALDGMSNAVGARLAQVALLVLGAGALLHWWSSPLLFRERSRLGTVVRALGSFSVVGMFAVALLPADRFAGVHPFVMALSGGPGLAAAACAAVGLASKERLAFGVGAAGLIVSALDLALYAGQLAGHDAGPLVAILERIALLVELAWMCVIAWRLRRAFQASPSSSSL
ncbi:MAG TPA: hypothetical protein VF765_21940 [Polyangiaceae bacterium]